ncbi:hypothetical protein Hanom_Chr07g00616131 [Helianthus anomalus]
MSIYCGFEVFSGDDFSLLLGVVTPVAAVVALSRILLVRVMMMMYHSEPISLCDNNDNIF